MIQRLHLGFDGCQLTVETNVIGVADFIARTYSPMLVDDLGSSVATITILREAPGRYRFRGSGPDDVDGAAWEPMLPYLKEQVVFELMRARRDLLWLHAASVERGGDALLIAGASGQGKSTLATLLCERGWRLMSDDVAAVRMDTDTVLSFLQSPSRRINPGRQVSAGEVGELKREWVDLPRESVRVEPARLGVVAFPTFDAESGSRLEQLTKGETALEILRYARNIVDHRHEAVAKAAKIAAGAAGFRIRYGDPAAAALLLDTLL